MGGSVNLQNGGSYSMPNIQGYGQRVAGYGQGAANYGTTAPGYGARYGMGDYGMPQQYDGGYGDFGGQFPGVSTGGKGFQQPTYQPAPVLQPYTSSPQMSYDTSTGGKGFQTRQTPAQSVAYAPMNIPQMQLAQPGFYYPNIGSQMANLNANYGIGGLGAMGAFGNYPMMMRQPAPMQMYPALAPPPPPPPPPTSTGGKGMRTKPPGGMQPSRPGYGPPTQPGYPPVGTGGKGFQPNPPFQPPIQPPYQPPTQPTYPNEPDYPDDGKTGGDQYLRPVRPEDYMDQDYGRRRYRPDVMPRDVYPTPFDQSTVAEEYDRPPIMEPDYYPTRGPIGQVADEYDRAPIMEPDYSPENRTIDEERFFDSPIINEREYPIYSPQIEEPPPVPSFEQNYGYVAPTGLNPQVAEEYDFMPERQPDFYPERLPPEDFSRAQEPPSYSPYTEPYTERAAVEPVNDVVEPDFRFEEQTLFD